MRRTFRRVFRLPPTRDELIANEIDDEIRGHLASREAQLRALGFTPQDAAREALARFGDLAAARDALRATAIYREKRLRSRELFAAVRQDARVALRLMRRQGTATAAAVLALAIGIGSTTVVFSVVNAIALRPLPFMRPSELVRVEESPVPRTDAPVTTVRMGAGGNVRVSPPTFVDLRRSGRVFAQLAALSEVSPAYVGPDGAERVQGAAVSANFMSMLGWRPQLGRFFRDDEDRVGAADVVIISHGFWLRRLGGDARVVGKSIQLDGRSFVIVGVMDPSANYPEGAQLWIPVNPEIADAITIRGAKFLQLIGRLQPGVTIAEAQQQAPGLGRMIAAIDPSNAGFSIAITGLQESIVGPLHARLVVLLSAVGLVLLITCTNVACLQLARAATRERELTVRVALGAGRGHLLRQLLTESTMLVALGAVVGVVAAAIALPWIVAHLPAGLPRVNEIALDGQALLITSGATALAAVIIGLAPIAYVRRANLITVLRVGRGIGGATARLGAQGPLVVGQLAITVVLLTGAALLVRSFEHLMSIPVGAKPELVTLGLIRLPSDRYPQPALKQAFYDRLVETLASDGRGRVVALATNPVLGGANMSSPVTVRGTANRRDLAVVQISAITPAYFDVVGTPLRRGRFFAANDLGAAPFVALVNETFARVYLGGGDAIGRELRTMFGMPVWRRVVGVVADDRHGGPATEVPPKMFVPLAQFQTSNVRVLVRSDEPFDRVAAEMQRSVRQLDSRVPLEKVQTLETALSATVAQPRFYASTLSYFALAALILVVTGLYGVVAQNVEQRRHEIGVRMALGADHWRVRSMVLLRALRLTVAGALIGVAGSLAATRSLRGFLYGVDVYDAATFGGVFILLLVVGGVAAAVPAVRASRVHPASSLATD
jgi:putative ABC transport system permease protein